MLKEEEGEAENKVKCKDTKYLWFCELFRLQLLECKDIIMEKMSPLCSPKIPEQEQYPSHRKYLSEMNKVKKTVDTP